MKNAQKRGGAATPAPTSSQINQFKLAARALGVDEDEAAFKEKLRVVARQGARSEAVVHASDCAMHNLPALPSGSCTCGATTTPR